MQSSDGRVFATSNPKVVDLNTSMDDYHLGGNTKKTAIHLCVKWRSGQFLVMNRLVLVATNRCTVRTTGL